MSKNLEKSRYNPFYGLREDPAAMFDSPIEKVMDQLFRSALGIYDRENKKGIGRAFFPKVDVAENKESFFIQAELPGVKKEDVKIEMMDDSMIISGHKESVERQTDKEKGFYHCESYCGDFRRVISFPCDIERENIKAKFNNGILTIDIPKSKKSIDKSKIIQIEG
ncbi:Hsp20/alpha crystallin family protein [Candidatus Sneabacter namystus]|uniref:Hsp20/alpha crystallin family protein n=1 Tax=Candidatus Sneabacter namystus TaxID=2601646 RepID=A0A5C0UJ28_9RICK|nr:Hsp20/alpha crystallin family protein [Candidatus Sneabacter namystus]QEK39799.1 Hsp20/alpha crystallin family protein [Candidatus Sneabacter namystus]